MSLALFFLDMAAVLHALRSGSLGGGGTLIGSRADWHLGALSHLPRAVTVSVFRVRIFAVFF